MVQCGRLSAPRPGAPVSDQERRFGCRVSLVEQDGPDRSPVRLAGPVPPGTPTPHGCVCGCDQGGGGGALGAARAESRCPSRRRQPGDLRRPWSFGGAGGTRALAGSPSTAALGWRRDVSLFRSVGSSFGKPIPKSTQAKPTTTMPAVDTQATRPVTPARKPRNPIHPRGPAMSSRPSLRRLSARRARRATRSSMLSSRRSRTGPAWSASRICRSWITSSRSDLRRLANHDAAARSVASTTATTGSHVSDVTGARYRVSARRSSSRLAMSGCAHIAVSTDQRCVRALFGRASSLQIRAAASERGRNGEPPSDVRAQSLLPSRRSRQTGCLQQVLQLFTA